MFTRATQCVRDVVDPPVSVFSLSLYRHPFLYTLFTSRFTLIINNNKTSKYRDLRILKLMFSGSLRTEQLTLRSQQTRRVYYESMERKLLKPIYECRCNGRLQTKRFTHLTHTGSVVELEHLKIKTRLTNEKFASVKGECEI
jgi:hypothetical protein